MKITILGATGNAGSRVVAEAMSRGHEVTAVVRESGVLTIYPPVLRFLQAMPLMSKIWPKSAQAKML